MELKKLSNKQSWEILKEDFIVADAEVTELTGVKRKLENNIAFENVTFLHNLYFKDVETKDIISFDNCTFKGSAIFLSLQAKHLVFSDCIFELVLDIQSATIHKLEINSCKFHEYTMLGDVTCEILSIVDTNTNDGMLVVNLPKIKKLRIIDLLLQSEIYITTNDADDLNYYLKELTLSFKTGFKGLITIEDIKINRVEVEGYNPEGRISLINVMCDDIDIEKFDNSGIINISSLDPITDNSSITLTNSNIGTVNLYDIDFSLFDVKIENSNIQEIIPANVKWCDIVETESSNKLKSRFSDLKEIYRQLKNVMIKSNNKPEELRFHSLEMTNYRLQLKDDKEHKLDRTILWLNKVSNDHGINPLYALAWIFFCSIIFYAINQALIGNYLLITVANTFKSVQDIIELINPVRKFTDVYPTSLDSSNWQFSLAKILDNIYKVISSYLIFQFITAFRKFVRK